MTSASPLEADPLLARKGRAAPASVHGRRERLADPLSPKVVKLDAIEGGRSKTAAKEPPLPLSDERSGSEVTPSASLSELDLVKTGTAETIALKIAPDPAPTPVAPVAETHETTTPAAPAAKPSPQGRVVTPSAEDRSGRWLWPAAAIVALAGIAAIGFYANKAESPAIEDPAGVAATSPAPVSERNIEPGQSEGALPVTAATEEPVPVDVGATQEPQVTPPSQTTAVSTDTASTPPAEASAEAPPQPEPAAAPGDVGEDVAAAPADIEASVDIVRIEPDGSAVIAGRAAPGSELIVLDNGQPIGTVTADQFGEWVFIPDGPLLQGEHEFGLVVKSVQGRVTVPASPASDPEGSAPGPRDDADAASTGGEAEDAALDGAVPPPPRKPVSEWIEKRLPAAQQSSAGPPDADFVVQLASVKTMAGAKQEWLKLQQKFPEILSGMKLNLYETRLNGQGVVIRVRTGAFSERRDAVDFCARFRPARQDCLVVRTVAAR